MHEKKKKKEKKSYIQRVRQRLRCKGIPVDRIYQFLTILLAVEFLQKWLQALTIDFKEYPIFKILNLHYAIWVNYLDDERPSPSRTEFTWKDVQSRAIQKYLLVRFKGLPYVVLVMEELDLLFVNSGALIRFTP